MMPASNRESKSRKKSFFLGRHTAAAFLDANVSECAFSVMDAEKMELKVLDSDMDEAAETSDKEADRREELNDDCARQRCQGS